MFWLQNIFPHSWAFLQVLIIITLTVTAWKCYKYIRRYQIARRRNKAATSDSVFNSYVPPELVEEIFSYLDLPSLLAAAQVNRHWHEYSCMASIRDPIFEKERVEPVNMQDVSDQVTALHGYRIELKKLDYSSPSYLKQWHAEDSVLAKRLNKQIVDTPLSSLPCLGYTGVFTKPLNNYLLKTRVCWKKETALFIHFFSSAKSEGFWTARIAKDQINIKNIGEEYEVIADLDGLSETTDIILLHRIRVTKVLDPKKALLMILMLLYAPILLMDLIENLRSKNSENFSHYLAHYAGIATMIYVEGAFLYDAFSIILLRTRGKKRTALKMISGIFLLISIYGQLVWNIFHIWRNTGLCWLIGGSLYLYYKLFKSIWFRRYYFGPKKSTAITAIAIILFIYALDWRLLLENIMTGKIWRTFIINIVHSLGSMLKINTENFIYSSLDYMKPCWTYFKLNTDPDRLTFTQGLLMQLMVVVWFTLYDPTGFDNLVVK